MRGAIIYLFKVKYNQADSLSLLLLGSRLGQLGCPLGDGGVGVELEHGPDVLQWVGLDDGSLDTLVGLPEHLADLFSLQQLGKVSDCHLRLGKVPASLLLGGHAPCAVEGVQFLESRLGPDAESTDVTAGSKLQEVQLGHLDGLHTGDVTEGFDETLVLIVDDEGSLLLNLPPVPQLTLAGAHPLGLVHLVNVVVGLVPLHEDHGLLGLGKGLDLVRHDHGDFGGLFDTVTFGHNEGGDAGGSDGRDHGVPLLLDGDLPVPPPVDLGGGEHVTSAAHVTESTLAGPVGTATADTGNTGYGTTGTPRLGAGLVAGIPVDAVGLPMVLGDLMVDERDDVWTNGGLEDSWKANIRVGRTLLFRVNRHKRTGSRKCHFDKILGH